MGTMNSLPTYDVHPSCHCHRVSRLSNGPVRASEVGEIRLPVLMVDDDGLGGAGVLNNMVIRVAGGDTTSEMYA